LQFVGFVDAAQLKFNNPVFGSPVEPHLMSYGVGARFAFYPKHQFRVDLAKVVSGVPIQPHGDMMLHVTFATSL
jgi:hemolysin activation/secretion protein